MHVHQWITIATSMLWHNWKQPSFKQSSIPRTFAIPSSVKPSIIILQPMTKSSSEPPEHTLYPIVLVLVSSTSRASDNTLKWFFNTANRLSLAVGSAPVWVVPAVQLGRCWSGVLFLWTVPGVQLLYRKDLFTPCTRWCINPSGLWCCPWKPYYHNTQAHCPHTT